MKPVIDETHDPNCRSFIDSANDAAGDFPIQNLPFGIFSRASRDAGPGVAIGDQIVDLRAAHSSGLLPRDIPREALAQGSLNSLFALGRGPLRNLRRALSALLSDSDVGKPTRQNAGDLLAPMSACRLYRPSNVANYSDFYAGIYHARVAGALLTPENPLPANYKWVPIAYHGRASSAQLGQGNVRRPLGQKPPAQDGAAPGFGPSERLDFELELGLYVTGGNPLGERIAIQDAEQQIVGYSLLNDWSARDVQRWEMFPLGPFLSKSFATSVSPWVVTVDALAPFQVPAMDRSQGDPQPLDYLRDTDDQAAGGLDIGLKVFLSTAQMRNKGDSAVEILTSNARHLYWTPAQMVAHHAVNGCNLQPGDLIGTGTISGPRDEELSSMLELTAGGTRPITLPNGEIRSFLADGDEITFKARCQRGLHRIWVVHGHDYGSVAHAINASVVANAKIQRPKPSSSLRPQSQVVRIRPVLQFGDHVLQPFPDRLDLHAGIPLSIDEMEVALFVRSDGRKIVLRRPEATTDAVRGKGARTTPTPDSAI